VGVFFFYNIFWVLLFWCIYEKRNDKGFHCVYSTVVLFLKLLLNLKLSLLIFNLSIILKVTSQLEEH
jgi:hypothetical protein